MNECIIQIIKSNKKNLTKFFIHFWIVCRGIWCGSKGIFVYSINLSCPFFQNDSSEKLASENEI